MATRAKPRRPYHSPRRREQAAATRRAILDAAQRLFERQGYAATSIAVIAAEAGVVPKTVHLAFETKSGLLRALWHLLLRGDEDPQPVGERGWYRAILDEPDPARKLRLTARVSREVKERAAGLMEVIRDAASVDRDAGELWGRIQSDFYENQRGIVESLADKGALRSELDVGRGADLLWSLNHPALYWLLTNDRGWSPRQYEQWLADTLVSQLLDAESPAGAGLSGSS